MKKELAECIQKGVYSTTMFFKRHESAFNGLFEIFYDDLIKLYFKEDRNTHVSLYNYKMCIYEWVFNKKRNFVTNLQKARSHFDYDRFKSYVSKDGYKYKDSSSLEHMIAVYGKDKGIEMFNEKISKTIISKDNLINKYGKEEGKKRWKDYKERLKFARTVEGYIEKYGEEEGKKRWDNICEMNRYTNTVDYYIEKYGEEEGTKIFNQKRRINCRVTEETLIEKYGEEEGKKRYKEKIEKHKFSRSLEGYIEKYGEEEGEIKYRELLSKHDTISLVSFISRHGEEEGKKRFNEYVSKSKFSRSLEGYIEKYGEEGRNKFLLSKTKNRQSSVSNISKECFDEIIQTLDLHNNKIYTDSINGEYCLILDKADRVYNNVYYYDFVDLTTGICIEFNGDIFHGNPNIYEKYETPNPYSNQTCEEIWYKDEFKQSVLKKYRNIDVFVIWEYDWRNDKNNVIEEIKEIYNERNI